MQPENFPESGYFNRFLSGKGTTDVETYSYPANYELPAKSSCSSSFCPWEISGFTDTPEARSLAASKNHKEAEKRRRERINSHLDRLRSLLPCNAKTDKASLLAKVIERVKELKQETSEIMQLENVPSESDEITIHTDDNASYGRLLIEASLCCEDRSDLIVDLIETLKSLHLKPLRAEMVTLGGRIRNVIIVSGENDLSTESVEYLKDALRSLIQRSSSESVDRSKRRRVFNRQLIA
ncbi:unnamed protein product [Ilex paraguariensis]|uniref:BHLH domain-containing protein n=1 Tax=Ilex paraguariensis TaxID=185542 RepID=A0ABC8V5C7_9AQUA